MSKHTLQELKQYQALPLNVKVMMTKDRIRGWVREFGEDGVYVSFSGGKDSTVLLHMVREEFPNIPAVFVDVPTQYPELREFAQTFENVEIIKPKMSFKEVCDKYGFPLISKEVASTVAESKKWFRNVNADTTDFDELVEKYSDFDKYKAGLPVRLLQMYGRVPHKEKGVISDEFSKLYDKSRHSYLLNSKFDISPMCCNVMKKTPVHDYEKKTDRKPFVGTMASESMQRTTSWIDFGCNAFEIDRPQSRPMSFWTEQDVLLYIKIHNLPICSVYGEVVEDWDEMDDIEGQMTISDVEGWGDMELFDADRPPLKTTGCYRTGCVLCGFGCHLEKPGEGRFEKLKETHPGFYNLIDVMTNNGVTYREAIEWINEHGNMNIRL